MKIIALHDLHYVMGTTGRKIHERFSDLLRQKIEDLGAEAVLIAGDISVAEQDQLSKFFELYRPKIKIPILVVLGNHDYWDNNPPYRLNGPRSFVSLREFHKEIFKKHDIHYLEDGPYRIRNVKFNGYDGWYREVAPPTNDLKFMRNITENTPTHLFLNYRSHKECERVLELAQPNLVNVCVSHFDATYKRDLHGLRAEEQNPYGGDHMQLNALAQVYDFIFYGHSHKAINELWGKARVLCAGGDYNHPIGMADDIPESIKDLKPKKDPVIELFKLSWTRRMLK